MKIKGTFKTEKGRKLSFDYTITDLEKTIGRRTTWTDNTFSVKSNLKINGEAIGINYYNFVNSDIFKRMYRFASVESIDHVEYTDKEKEFIGDYILASIENDYTTEFNEWFRNKYGYTDDTSSIKVGEDFIYYIDEYIRSTESFRILLIDSYEFCNGYHCLSQMNLWLDGILEMLIDEFDEDMENIA